jgi:peptidoglycan/LPS O-acetylase OafA/YrhL
MSASAVKAARPAGHLDVLDGVRALAAFSVVATHVGFQTGRAVNGFFAPFLARLDFGVTLFFLLSGFLLYRPFVEAAIDLRPKPETKPFLLRRFARIFPAYWVLLVLTMLIRPWEHSTGLSVQKTTWTDWIEYATLTHIYFGDNPHQALTHIWSLVVELSFYLVLPFIAGFALRGRRPRRIMRRQTIVLGVLAAVGPAYGVIVHQIPSLQNRLALQWLPAYFDWFALGMVLAALPAAASVGAWPRLRRLADELAMAPGTCWIIAGILFALSMTPVAGPYSLEASTTSQWLAKHVLYGVTAFFMLLPLVGAGDSRHLLRAALSDRRVRWLGEISYSIFLFHLVLMFTLVDALHLKLFKGGFSTLFPLTVLCAVAAAALSYRLIERPAQNYIRRRTKRGATEPAMTTSPVPADAGGPENAVPAGSWSAPLPKPGGRQALPHPVASPATWENQPPVQLGPWVQQPAAPVTQPPVTPLPAAQPVPLTEATTEPIPMIPPPAQRQH